MDSVQHTLNTLIAGGSDTIVATATAPGRGAVAMIRMSGARALSIARALGALGELPTPRTAYRTALRDAATGEALDDGLAVWFAAPNSYTGEDVVELYTHGGLVAPVRVLEACIRAGARAALPGEFTRRAVLNGRMDILQAEAVGDIIDARTSALQQAALVQLDGGLSRRLLALREKVIHLEALIAYDIDFPEEDDGPIAPERIGGALSELIEALRALLATVPRGNVLRDGALVVLAGAPNAGKSSLFNALLGEARAIVTAVPGTTRDAIEALLDRKPFPLRLVDTAGLRDTSDEVERLGIEVSAKYLAQAQVVLACGESIELLEHTVWTVESQTSATVVAVHTKYDLAQKGKVSEGAGSSWFVSVSAERGEGLVELLDAVDKAMGGSLEDRTVETVVITRERHRAGLALALDELEQFEAAWQQGELPAAVASVHLFAAREALGDLIGTIDTEDVLDRVFRDFCVGK